MSITRKRKRRLYAVNITCTCVLNACVVVIRRFTANTAPHALFTNIIKADVPAFVVRETGEEVKTKSHNLVAIPYYAWSHRGIGEMLVWLPRRAKKLEIITD